MTTELLLHGLQDIVAGRIATEAIADMAPYIRRFMPNTQLHDSSIPILGDNYTYIAGKVTGINYLEAYTLFTQVEHDLLTAGLKPINPLRVIPSTAPWDSAMCLGIVAMVKHCDKIHLLQNWTSSKGAMLEKNIADILGIRNIKY